MISLIQKETACSFVFLIGLRQSLITTPGTPLTLSLQTQKTSIQTVAPFQKSFLSFNLPFLISRVFVRYTRFASHTAFSIFRSFKATRLPGVCDFSAMNPTNRVRALSNWITPMYLFIGTPEAELPAFFSCKSRKRQSANWVALTVQDISVFSVDNLKLESS